MDVQHPGQGYRPSRQNLKQRVARVDYLRSAVVFDDIALLRQFLLQSLDIRLAPREIRRLLKVRRVPS